MLAWRVILSQLSLDFDGGWWYVTIPLLDQSCRIFYAPSDIVRLTKRLGGFYKMVTAPRVAQPKLSKG